MVREMRINSAPRGNRAPLLNNGVRTYAPRRAARPSSSSRSLF
jgi:hypothetical protein